MTAELTPRQALVRTLSGDLLAGPWGHSSKLYFLKGSSGDEWLEFVDEFESSVDHRLLDVILERQLPVDAVGILVATEGWDYPKRLADSLRAKGDQAVRTYWSLYPPSDHPQRVSTRNLLLTCSDGEVIGLTSRQDDAETPAWAHLDPDVPCPTGNRTIDTARAILGQFPEYLNQLEEMREGLRAAKTMDETINAAIAGTLTENEATIRLLEAMPDEQRAQMFDAMPDGMRAALRRTLTEEQAQRFGLDE